MRQRLEDIGYRVILVEEQATKFVQRGFSPFATWNTPADFQRHMLRAITMAEAEAYVVAQDLRPKKHTVFLCDRGAPSGGAYIDKSAFEAIAKREGFSLLELYDRYRIAIFFVTAADGAEEYYTVANNAARSEVDPAVAREVDRRTRLAWQGHRRLSVVDNSTGFDEKIRRGFNELARILHMPDIPAHEIERKFVILNYRPEFIPKEAGRVLITQDYLTSSETGLVRRVRKREADGAATYFYTEKRETGILGKRLEHEPQISPDEYARLLEEKEPGVDTVSKWRSTHLYGGHYLEHDSYVGPTGLEWLHVLEIEVRDLGEKIEFPPEFELVEVTADTRFSNYGLAAGQLKGVTLEDLTHLPRVR